MIFFFLITNDYFETKGFVYKNLIAICYKRYFFLKLFLVNGPSKCSKMKI